MKNARAGLAAFGTLLLGLGVFTLWTSSWTSTRGGASGPALASVAPSLRTALPERLSEEPAFEPAPRRKDRRVEVTRRRFTLHARIVDFDTREPIEEALFHVRHEEGYLRTDPEGELRHPHTGEGPIEFEAGAEGYCVVRGRVEAERARDPELLEIPLLESSPIEGQVVGPDGWGIGGSFVFACVQSGREDEVEHGPPGYPEGWVLAPEGLRSWVGAETDGSFRLSGLVPYSTRYELRAWGPGHHETSVPIHARGPGVPTYVEVELESKPAPPPRPTGVVQGRVEHEGDPSQWIVDLGSGESVDYQGCDEDSTYRFAMVRPGEVVLIAHPIAWYVMRELREAYGTRVQVGPGETMVCDLRLDLPVQTLRGRVIQPFGESERITLFAENPLVSVQGLSNPDGSFTLEVPDLGAPYELSAGMGIGSVTMQDLLPGASGIELVLPEVADFFVAASCETCGSAFYRFELHVRRAGESNWKRAQGHGYSKTVGHRFRAFPGTIDLWIESRGHQPRLLTGVQILCDPPTHLEVELVHE